MNDFYVSWVYHLEHGKSFLLSCQAIMYCLRYEMFTLMVGALRFGETCTRSCSLQKKVCVTTGEAVRHIILIISMLSVRSRRQLKGLAYKGCLHIPRAWFLVTAGRNSPFWKHIESYSDRLCVRFPIRGTLWVLDHLHQTITWDKAYPAGDVSIRSYVT